MSPRQDVQVRARPLALEDRFWMEPLLRLSGRAFSETSFANLYLFRHVHAYRVNSGDWPAVTGVTYDGATSLTPLFPLSEPSRRDWTGMLGGGAHLYPTHEEDLVRFEEMGFSVHCNDNDSDYLYDTADLASLGGRAVRAKRSAANAFELTYSPKVAELDESTQGAALHVLEAWQRDVDKPWAATDFAACREGIERQRDLGLFGLVVFVSAEPVGFVLASEVTGAAVVHFAKGKRAFPGVFPYMFRLLAQTLGARFPVLNFEQDLGIPGLRQSKRAFAPKQRLRKYRVTMSKLHG